MTRPSPRSRIGVPELMRYLDGALSLEEARQEAIICKPVSMQNGKRNGCAETRSDWLPYALRLKSQRPVSRRCLSTYTFAELCIIS